MENTGILAQNSEPAKAGVPNGETGKLDYEQMIADMETRLPENLKEAWNRIMAAGMKFLFDQKTNPMVNEYLEGEGEIATKIGEGSAGLIAFLDKEARGALPKELIIPAGMALMIEVVKYVQKAGIVEVTVQDFGNAVQIYLEKVLGVYGGTMEMMEKTLEVASKDAGGHQPGIEQPAVQPEQGAMQ